MQKMYEPKRNLLAKKICKNSYGEVSKRSALRDKDNIGAL